MTVKQFKEIMEYNEPDFGYRGEEYSICWPNGVYYVTASDNPQDQDLSFSSVDEMLDHWLIQGKPLREILPEIDLQQVNDYDSTRIHPKLKEEVFAYISGMINVGTQEEYLRPMFRNYDAVKAAWYELIRKNR